MEAQHDEPADLLLEREGEQLLYLPLFNFAHGNFDDIHEMITSPNTLFGLSDAGAHCGAICDASMTTSSMTVWSRDRTRGDRIPIEQIVYGHTPAGGRRLMQTAEGYRWTVKGGAVTFDGGQHTGELPGTLLRGTRPAPH